MIYRPHFTYLAVATPSQVQAREAAANREWRRKLLFPLAGIPRPPPPRKYVEFKGEAKIPRSRKKFKAT